MLCTLTVKDNRECDFLITNVMHHIHSRWLSIYLQIQTHGLSKTFQNWRICFFVLRFFMVWYHRHNMRLCHIRSTLRSTVLMTLIHKNVSCGQFTETKKRITFISKSVIQSIWWQFQKCIYPLRQRVFSFILWVDIREHCLGIVFLLQFTNI